MGENTGDVEVTWSQRQCINKQIQDLYSSTLSLWIARPRSTKENKPLKLEVFDLCNKHCKTLRFVSLHCSQPVFIYTEWQYIAISSYDEGKCRQIYKWLVFCGRPTLTTSFIISIQWSLSQADVLNLEKPLQSDMDPTCKQNVPVF